MPVFGWMAGLSGERFISGDDHRHAFGLLAGLGGKMIYEALQGEARENAGRDPTRGASLAVLSVPRAWTPRRSV
jgi:putative Mn2+ efflux pump MntP